MKIELEFTEHRFKFSDQIFKFTERKVLLINIIFLIFFQISYLYFLLFFNFMALNQLDQTPGKLAHALLCYIIAFALEEIRQVSQSLIPLQISKIVC